MVTNLTFNNVKINGGFLKKRYDLNKNVSIKSVYERFEETGRFDALRFNYPNGKGKPHCYYDSDVAKWIEAVSYLIINEGGYLAEQKVIDEIVSCMAKNQLRDGYLNSHFIQIEPQNRFTDRNMHELYCAGHLIEASIAYDKATAKHEFLTIMKKYVDCIERCFVIDKTAKFVTCGHEEIELALIKLYDYTGEERYLRLAMFFIDNRGIANESGIYPDVFTKALDQSEVAVRELSLAQGHAVRATYLYIAMAESALKTGDTRLLDACKRVWRDIVDKKMYVTGGIGSSRKGEAFTTEYDLPTLEAYSESCSAIGLALFALSMQQNELNAEYGDVIERVMYNSMLSPTSLDGKSFFYENPLEIHLASVDKETSLNLENKTVLPIRHRLEVFNCSCCPPNVNRIFARIGDFFFSKYKNSFVINQYSAVSYDDGKNKIEIVTNYPNDGKVTLKIDKTDCGEILLRKPSWCESYSISVNAVEKNGYISIPAICGVVQLNFDIKPYFVECNPLSRANAGRVALLYGPIVYCIERIDNDYELNALAVDVSKKVTALKVDETYGMRTLKASAVLDESFNGLYRKITPSQKNVTLTYIPYYAFANREECDMLVWVRKK